MSTPRPLIGFGQVRHTRLRPRRHAFAYGNWFCLLPMRALARQPEPALHRNQRGWLAFHDADHGQGGPDALAWFDALLKQEGLWHDDLAQGEVWLQTYPRVLGYTFKPVSFWYAHRADGALHAVVAEVNNTFGQRHCYILTPPAGRDAIPWGHTLLADKCLHVSPFCEVRGGYSFRFMRTPERLLARIDHDDGSSDGQGPLIQTSISGELHELNARSLRRAVLSNPLLTLGVFARIHWQALQLWLKGLPVFSLASQPSPKKNST
jgi:uncharacterized protein